MEAFFGTIVLYSGDTTPNGWTDCDGKILPLNTEVNKALFSLMGYNYGGTTNKDFALPKLANIGSARHIICCEGPYPPRE